MIKYCLEQKDWFSFNDMVDESCRQAIAAKSKGTKYLGSPSTARQCAMHLAEIGFLALDPLMGAKVNTEWVPLSQKNRKLLE